MVNFDQLIEAVKQQMQPASRVQHLIGMLEHLSSFTPDDVTLSDLITGWQFLACPQSHNEVASVTHRREVYAELAATASKLTNEPGNLAQAVKNWQAWQSAFQSTTNIHQNAMAKTLARELAELQSTPQDTAR